MCFQLVQIRIFRQKLCKIFRSAKCIKISKYCVSFQFSRIFHPDMSRIGKHTEHFLLNLLRLFRQIDTVPERFAHFRFSVNSRKPQTCLIFREKDLRIYKCIPIYGIKLMNDLFCLFDHRHLIFADRNSRRLKRRNIRRLTDRICEKSYRNTRLEITHFNLCFYSRVSLKS